MLQLLRCFCAASTATPCVSDFVCHIRAMFCTAELRARPRSSTKSIEYVVQWLTQPEAQAECIRRGGQLLTMENVDERNWLRSTQLDISTELWIGLQATQATQTPSDFTWLSSGRATLRKWWFADAIVTTPSSQGLCVVQGREVRGWRDRPCK